MFRLIKVALRKFIPNGMQVPIKYWYAFFRGYLEPEIKILGNIINENDHVIDIGANRGVYSYFFSKHCKNIELFEPNPECSRPLQFWSNNLNGIHLHNVALSNEEGSGSLLIPVDDDGIEHDSSASIENNDFQNTKITEVPLKKLDSYFFEDVSFIKIDVEGHELSVLKGAVNTIEKYKPNMLIEIEQRHNKIPISEIFSFISKMGYRIFFLDQNKLNDLSKFNVKLHQDPYNFDIGSKYINNFLCLCDNKLALGKLTSLDHLFQK